MEFHRHSRSSLFLIEMILVILFFSIGSVICVQVFAAAYQCTKESEALSHGQLLTSSMAEALMGDTGKDDTIKTYFPDASIEKNEIRVYYNDNWDSCGEEEASYLLLASREQENNNLTGTVSLFSVANEKTPVYSLPFSYHIAYRKGETA